MPIFSVFAIRKKILRKKTVCSSRAASLAEFLPEENENNYEYLYEIKQMAKRAGLFYYCKVPWKKGGFVSNTGRKA